MKYFSWSLLAVLAMVVMLTGCGGDHDGRLATAQRDDIEAQHIGQGGTTFRFEVLDLENDILAWYVSTNETRVGAALLDLGLIAGDEGAFGLFVTEVNGIYADFAANGTWWAFYIDGASSMTGVDITNIEQGRTYAFVLTES